MIKPKRGGGMKWLSVGVIVLVIILLSGQGCSYADYLRQTFVKEKEGEVCVKTADGVICGTPEEISKQKTEGQLVEKEAVKEEVKEEVVGYLPEKITTEGGLVSFPNLRAVDPDGDPITYKFGEPLNEKGEWQTKEGDAGEYIATVYATDGKSEISQNVKIIVKKFNHPPEIEKIADIIVNEGEAIKLEPKATDADGDKVTLGYSGFMDSAEKQTGFGDAGTYTVTITASDGEKTAMQDVGIVVKNVNRPPVLEPIGDISAVEKELVKITPKAADPDDDSISFTFSQPFNEKGEWQTKQGSQGSYEVTVTASDGELSATATVKVFVEYFDKPPVFEKMQDITVSEGEIVVLKPLAFDPERKELTYTYSGFMKEQVYKTTFDDAGEHEQKITVSDGVNEVSQTIKITVNNVNRPPVFVEGAFE